MYTFADSMAAINEANHSNSLPKGMSTLQGNLFISTDILIKCKLI